VIRLRRRDHLPAIALASLDVIAPGELDRHLDGVRSGDRELHATEPVRSDRDQLVRQTFLEWVREPFVVRVGELLGLDAGGLDDVAPAVAEAAMASGVATRPVADLRAYRDRLARFVYHSGTVMQPVFAAATEQSCRIVYAEGEDERVLRAAQIIVDENLAHPILIGRRDIIEDRRREYGLRFEIGHDVEIIDPGERVPTQVGADLVNGGGADGLLCGTTGNYSEHLAHIAQTIGLRDGVNRFAAMNLLMLPRQTVFICDTYVNVDPNAVEIAEMAVLAAEEVRRFGLTPRLALLSHSSFGSADTPSARKMRAALALIRERAPGLEAAGEMQGDAALSKRIFDRVRPEGGLTAEANLLIMPNLDAANITFNCLMTVAGEGVTVGPILLGA
jgi:malate dehydrogenase (oxaloacetate-decarboxylating)(NADP+)